MGWGKGGASIGQGAFIREGRLIQTIHPKGGVNKIRGSYFRVAVY